MKRYIAGILLILLLATLCWAQGTTRTFDQKKSREELEIMKGILGTTISFVGQNSRSQPVSPWRYSKINAFYLAGQGAVFLIPSSTLRGSGINGPFIYFGDLSQSITALSGDIAEFSARAAEQATSQALSQAFQNARSRRAGIGAGIGAGAGAGTGGASDSENPPLPPAAPTPPATAAAPAPPTPPEINREELRKKIEDYQEKAKKVRETAEANQQKFLQKLDEVKGLLVETLANYGDSMTTIKPGEYINVVLTVDSWETDPAGLTENVRGGRQEIISVQKSWITEYKAGKLTMDGFKQKVLQYSE